MFHKTFKDISLADVNQLITDSILENETLEYKGYTDAGSIEKGLQGDILRTVIAFANTNGGILICGLKEDQDGKASEILGIPNKRGKRPIDEWASSVIVANIQPRIILPQVKIIPIEGLDNECLLLIKVTRSHYRPHSTSEGGNFFVRHNRATDPASADEVKRMVLNVVNENTDRDKFLLERNLLNTNDRWFGVTYWGRKVDREAFSTIRSIHTPLVVISFVPKNLQKYLFDTGDKELQKFTLEAQKGCYPLDDRKNLISNASEYSLYTGIEDFSILMDVNNRTKNLWTYLQITHHGYIETAISNDVFWVLSKRDHSLYGNIFMRTGVFIPLVGAYASFAMKFYQHIELFDPIELRIAFCGMENVFPSDFAKQNGKKELEVYDWLGGNKEKVKCRSHNFVISHIFDPTNEIEKEVDVVMEKISKPIMNAFGITEMKCLMENGKPDPENIRRIRE